MRALTLNLLTYSATLLLLAAIAIPAVRLLERPSAARPRVTAEVVRQPFLGVTVDPWHVDEWSRAVGERPQALGKFEAFSRRRSLVPYILEAERQGVPALMISWEPWRPVPAARGRDAQFRPQPGYRNADIAAGAQDLYVRRFARTLKRFDGVVYLRYGHEMNGIWYPWSHDPQGYRRAWRRIVSLFRRAGADNVRFVWSVNPNLYQPPGVWLRVLRRYWPGREYVDDIGATMIDFGGRKDYPVPRFSPRLQTLHRVFGKPLIITEANTEYEGRVAWLQELRRLLVDSSWIHGVVWSQLPSRGKAQMAYAGRLDWDVQHDPPSAAVLRSIARQGEGAGGSPVAVP
jgi:hypothetical protein